MRNYICPAFDARKSQVYAALFQRVTTTQLITIVPTAAYAPKELAKQTQKYAKIYTRGNGHELLKPHAKTRFIEDTSSHPEVSSLAIACIKSFKHKHHMDCNDTLAPEYYRLSEAEESLLQKKQFKQGDSHA